MENFLISEDKFQKSKISHEPFLWDPVRDQTLNPLSKFFLRTHWLAV